MSKLEVVMATMGQTDFSLVEKLNIKCNVLFANQTDNNSYVETETEHGKARMVSTTTRGVGVDRNIGISYSVGNILLFADDDLVYNSDMPQKVKKAFEELEEADVIIFGVNISKNGEICRTMLHKTGKLPVLKSMKYGTHAVAIRRSSLLRENLKFNELFGGGCIYSHGEDSDFIFSCYKRKLKVYAYEYVLGTTAKDESTWFKGFDEKYFYDAGALSKNTFGLLSYPHMLRLAIKAKSQDKMTIGKKIEVMLAGYKNYKNNLPYGEWKKGKNNE